MKNAALRIVMVVGVIACTLLAPSLAGERRMRRRQCLSDRVIRTSEEACCAFTIVTQKGTSTPAIKAVGRVVRQDVIQQNFVLKAADAGLDVEQDAFLAQAAGQDFLFVCPPGTQLLPEVEVRAAGRRRKLSVSRALRLLRTATGFFGVRRPPATTPPMTTMTTAPVASQQAGSEVVVARGAASQGASGAQEAVAVEEAGQNKEDLNSIASEVMRDMLSEMLDDDDDRLFT